MFSIAGVEMRSPKVVVPPEDPNVVARREREERLAEQQVLGETQQRLRGETRETQRAFGRLGARPGRSMLGDSAFLRRLTQSATPAAATGNPVTAYINRFGIR